MVFFRNYKSLLTGILILCGFILLRVGYTGSLRFVFLIWNFMLAVLPLYFSYLLVRANAVWKKHVFACLWLLFLPNAPYLLTDICHLHAGTGALYWQDMILLFAGASCGLVITMVSLRSVEAHYIRGFSRFECMLVRFFVLLLCGYGIYLGRVERWNSWDVACQPVALLSSMYDHIRHPFRSREAWYVTVVFAFALQLAYILVPKKGRYS